MMASPLITRFAPSPTGFLHLGHARAAQIAFDYATREGGTCLLRIEDIDHMRCRKDFTDAIFEDLGWLGFDWPSPVRIQSDHIKTYKSVISHLTDLGLTYPCDKSRPEIKASMARRGLSAYVRDDKEFLPALKGNNIAWRLSMMACRAFLGEEFYQLGYWTFDLEGNRTWRAVRPDRFGDVVIARKDIGVSYHIAVTHDDHIQKVSHIIRGQDLESQTDIHVLINRLMGWSDAHYHHHPLIHRPDGQKLAKRNSDPSIRSMREAGLTVRDIFENIA